MKPIDPALKNFLLTWVIPPGIEAARQRRLIPDLQKFWRGEPVPAPPLEAEYFASCGLRAHTITHDDDSRVCAPVGGRVRLALPDAARGEAIQLAVAADRWPRGASVSIRAGTSRVRHTGLRPRRWLDIRLDVPDDADAIEIEADAPLHASFPRAVQTRARSAAGIRHVLVLVLDALIPDIETTEHPSLPGGIAPNIARFFADGFWAPNGFSSGEWTMPAAASLFTGLTTLRHGMFHPTLPTTMPDDRTTLAEHFQRAGFHTFGLSAANRLTPAFMCHRGFDRFIYHWAEEGFTSRDYDPAAWVAEILGHLAVYPCDRTFTYAHFPDTHPVWNIPPLTRSFNLMRRGDSTGHDLESLREFEQAATQGRLLTALRLNEIDRLLGGLFAHIERHHAGETLVVLTADHGTPWHQLRPGRPADEPTLVNDRIRIAFRMRSPGVAARRFDGLVMPTLDLMPTLLARCGLPVPQDLDGRDMLDPAYHRDVAFTESLYGGVYELAMHDRCRTLIEKFPMHDRPIALAGPCSYRKAFPAGATDYNVPLAEDCAELAELARAHRERYGLIEPAA